MADTLRSTRTLIYPADSTASLSPPEYNYQQGDYAKLRRIYDGATESGIQLGGLFAQPIVNFYTAMMIGNLPTFIIRDDKSDKELPDETKFVNQFMAEQHHKLIESVHTSLKLGDALTVFNLDRSLETIPPDMADVGFQLFGSKVHSLDVYAYRYLRNAKTGRKNKVKISRHFDREQVIYEAKAESSQFSLSDFGKPKIVLQHDLGETPVLWLANNKDDRSVFGWSEFGPCIPYMNIIHAIVMRGFESQQYNGKPILSVTGIEGSVQAWLTQTFGIDVTKDDDESVRQKMMDFFEKFKFFAFPGKDIKAAFLESQYPIGATKELYELAFQAMVAISTVPEFMFGRAIGGSNATVREQYAAIKGRMRVKRTAFGAYLRKLAQWALFFYSTIAKNEETDETLETFGFVRTLEDLNKLRIDIVWPEVINSDEQMKLDVMTLLSTMNGLPFQSAYEAFPQYFPNPDRVLELLRSENADTTLPAKATSGFGANSLEKDANAADQRGRDDKGSAGDNSGKTGSGNK